MNEPLKIIVVKSKVATACERCDYVLIYLGGCPSRMMINQMETRDEPLDCVLKKTAFDIVKNIDKQV